jgi:transposase-like protein
VGKRPVKGVISDGQETIGSAMAFVFPEVPHQGCHFHAMKDVTKPLSEADQHAKTHAMRNERVEELIVQRETNRKQKQTGSP